MQRQSLDTKPCFMISTLKHYSCSLKLLSSIQELSDWITEQPARFSAVTAPLILPTDRLPAVVCPAAHCSQKIATRHVSGKHACRLQEGLVDATTWHKRQEEKKRLPKRRKKHANTLPRGVDDHLPSTPCYPGLFISCHRENSTKLSKRMWKFAESLRVYSLAGFKIRPRNPWAQLAFISELRVGCDITRILTHIEVSQPCVSGIMKLRNTHLHNEGVLIMHHDSSG